MTTQEQRLAEIRQEANVLLEKIADYELANGANDFIPGSTYVALTDIGKQCAIETMWVCGLITKDEREHYKGPITAEERAMLNSVFN